MIRAFAYLLRPLDPGSAPGGGTYPTAGQVLDGVSYGPSGADYTGTLIAAVDPTPGDPPAVQIKDILEGEGEGIFAAASGWAICVGAEPDGPDTVIVINEPSGLTPDPRWAFDRPAVEVTVRGGADDYLGPRAKIESIKQRLLGRAASTALRGITMRGDIAHLGRDEKGRHAFVATFQLVFQPTSVGNRKAI